VGRLDTLPGLLAEGERVGDPDRDAQGLAQSQGLARQESPEVRSRDLLHHEEVHSIHRLDLVDGDDVRMVEGGGGAGLLEETAATILVGQATFGQDLDRHLPAEAGVAGAVHLAHAARAKRRYDFVRPKACSGGQDHRYRLEGCRG